MIIEIDKKRAEIIIDKSRKDVSLDKKKVEITIDKFGMPNLTPYAKKTEIPGLETDPVFQASAAFGINPEDIQSWDSAFGWGDHAQAGYLTDAPSDGNAYGRKDGDWEEIAGVGGAVDSVFGRTGVVVAEAGDYEVSEITGLQTALSGKLGFTGNSDRFNFDGTGSTIHTLTEIGNISGGRKGFFTYYEGGFAGLISEVEVGIERDGVQSYVQFGPGLMKHFVGDTEMFNMSSSAINLLKTVNFSADIAPPNITASGQITTGGAPLAGWESDADDLIVANNVGGSGMTIYSTDSSLAKIVASKPGSGSFQTRGRINYDFSREAWDFITNGMVDGSNGVHIKNKKIGLGVRDPVGVIEAANAFGTMIFEVDNLGNVDATSFTGDASGLTNLPFHTHSISDVTGLQTVLDAKIETETDPVFSASEAANFVSGDAAKLAGIEAGAEVNVGEEFSAAEQTKLAGIAEGATANATDAFLLDRGNHTGDADFSGAVLEGAKIKNYTESLETISSSSGTLTANLNNANEFKTTLTENVTTFTISNVSQENNIVQGFNIEIAQDSTGGRTFAFPASVKWAGGTAPTLSTGANAIDILGFKTSDKGVTWLGFFGGLNFS